MYLGVLINIIASGLSKIFIDAGNAITTRAPRFAFGDAYDYDIKDFLFDR